MKKLSIIFFFISFFSSAQEELTSTVARLNKIKTRTQQAFFKENDKPSMTYVWKYDKNGLAQTCTWTENHVDTIVTRQYFYYNVRKQKVKEVRVDYAEKDSARTEMNFEYEANGKPIEWDDNEEKPEIRLKRNDKGKLIEKLEIRKKYTNKTTYLYDEKKRITKETYFVNEEMSAAEEINYNAEGKISERIFTTYKDGKTVEKKSSTVYEYNEKGLLAKISHPGGEDEKQTLIFTYTYE
jgi:hypothetical protein